MLQNPPPAHSLLRQVQEHLLTQGYGPGDQVEPEVGLAKRFHVSRGQIREVLTTLAHQGIVERRARRGTVIRSLNPQQVGTDLRFRFQLAGFSQADAHEAREIIETAILPLVIRRITPVLLERLEQLIARMAECLTQPAEFDLADKAFHQTLLEACGNRTLSAFSSIFEYLFEEDHRRRYWTRARMEESLNEHRLLLVALRRNDETEALSILRHHLAHWHDMICDEPAEAPSSFTEKD